MCDTYMKLLLSIALISLLGACSAYTKTFQQWEAEQLCFTDIECEAIELHCLLEGGDSNNISDYDWECAQGQQELYR